MPYAYSNETQDVLVVSVDRLTENLGLAITYTSYRELLFHIVNGVIALVVNFLVVLVLASNWKKRNAIGVLMLNVAFTNLLYVTCLLPMQAVNDYYGILNWQMGRTSCKMFHYLKTQIQLSIAYSLVFMAIDRFYAAVYPTSGKVMRFSFIKTFAVPIMWIPILIVSVFASSVFELKEEYDDTICNFIDAEWFNAKQFVKFETIYSFGLPLSVSSVLLLLALIWIRLKETNKISKPEQNDEIHRTVMVFVLILVFIILWAPHYVVFSQRILMHHRVEYAFIIYAMANSSFSLIPTLYMCMAKEFRETLWKGRIRAASEVHELSTIKNS